jgi:ribosomal protein S12 methylthiotransferase accessory factor
VRSPADHTWLYAQRAHFRRADFLAATVGTVKAKAVAPRRPKNAQQLYARIKDLGMRVAYVEITPERAALAQGRTPLHVARAIVPGLVPVSFGYDTEPLGMKRLAGAHVRRPLFPHPLG